MRVENFTPDEIVDMVANVKLGWWKELGAAKPAAKEPHPPVTKEPEVVRKYPPCYVAAPDFPEHWQICTRFLNERDNIITGEVCHQCIHGYENPFWKAGKVRERLFGVLPAKLSWSGPADGREAEQPAASLHFTVATRAGQ